MVMNSMRMSANGFTLIEVMIAVVIIGILASIAYPNYQQYVVKTKRTDMMSEMHDIATTIQERKLVQGKYSNAIVNGLGGNYPKSGKTTYRVRFTPEPLTSEWNIIATPVDPIMVGDGDLSLNFQGRKCRANVCGADSGWN